jgi:hypothetical protein
MSTVGTFESEFGKETVDVPQEAIDVMISLFGKLRGNYAKTCISPEQASIGPFTHVSYGSPYTDDSKPGGFLHLENTEELAYDLERDLQLLARLRELREKMARLGFSAETNKDLAELGGYGECYDKEVPAAELRQEFTTLMSEFGITSSPEPQT